MIFAHAFLGLILASLFEKLLPLSTNYLRSYQKMVIWSAFVIGAVFPDFDFLYLFFIDNSVSHRLFVTHSILPYVALLLLGITYIRSFKKDILYENALIAFTIGVISHLLSDSVLDKVYFINPLTYQYILFQPFELNKDLGFAGYITSPYMIMESAISLFGFYLLIINLYKTNYVFRFMLGLIGIIQLGVAFALMPFLQSFN